ncbi:acyl-CoA carboxylase subunit epsilon [Streptomyces sp. SP18CS02]|uniref:acyl-CoA carboxylase subunit epsilon n=1 Tax=Streptomyces sp. SP18CS02 TaxID=3002531 RepID=UPI002E76B04B|nr:acyl-CoA carboxylase subunit epsilon [Streptomyces sp. SP18CS02]MEE1757461.1 acyl-CoA carboxylase subunit epsilon [Streptomyces sp. SP18CS02]
MSDHLRIVHGSPNAVELAALTAVLTALACRQAAQHLEMDPAPPRAHWDRSWKVHLSPGSWRCGSGFPYHRR